MTVYSWPAGVLPVRASFTLLRQQPASPTAPGTSPRITVRPGDLWQGQAEFSLLDAPRWGRLSALLDAANDREGVIEVPAFDRVRPATWDGSAPPAPAVAFLAETAFIGASTLKIGGLAASARQVGPGDRFSIDGRLYRVASTEPVTSDGGGVATIRIAPALREDAFILNEVRLMQPVCKMRFAGETSLAVTVQKPMRGSMTLSFIEAGLPISNDETGRFYNLFGHLANVVMPAALGVA